MYKLDPMTEYAHWLSQPDLPAELRRELEDIRDDESAIIDRFWRHLSFGTGGLRGEMGAGTNRMNRCTVARATRGLAAYLEETFEKPMVCVAYDTRHHSREFAECAALQLASRNIRVRLFEGVRPTPMLSFAVRHHGAAAGIVITASHNPKQYNGYKVYGPDGGQITDAAALSISAHIGREPFFCHKNIPTLEEVTRDGLISFLGEETDKAYYHAVERLALRPDLMKQHAADLHILYTPLHGAGSVPVRRVLENLGFSKVEVVDRQLLPDGDFPTVTSPNPEEPAAFELALEQAKNTRPDLVFATDPDCDRIGVCARREDGSYRMLTGNQIGVLLCDYLLGTRTALGILSANGAVVKTIVTTRMVNSVCEGYGVAVTDTLTGFKYIGEKITEWAKVGSRSFLFGFEESYGYLAGSFVRDKDAVIAAALVAEMALWCKMSGASLEEHLDKLYQRHGFFLETLLSFELPGQDGTARIEAVMAALREAGGTALPRQKLLRVEDYLTSVTLHYPTGDATPIDLPKSNVLKYVFWDNSWMAFRPSGTEPKIKVYVGAIGEGRAAAETRLQELTTLAQKKLQVGH